MDPWKLPKIQLRFSTTIILMLLAATLVGINVNSGGWPLPHMHSQIPHNVYFVGCLADGLIAIYLLMTAAVMCEWWSARRSVLEHG